MPAALRYAGAGALMLVLAAFTEHPWDGFVLRRTVEDWVLAGRTPYATAQDMPLHAYTGSSYPIFAQWFAYPPLALLAITATAGPAVALEGPLWLVRLLVKVPAIAGALLCARLVHAMVPPSAAPRAEAWLLFAPAVVIVAGVWGQFEPLLAACLLASAWAMERERWRWAGAAFAAAVLLKPFALFLAPLWLLHAWRRAGRSAVLPALASGSLLALAVCLPFLAATPQGFWSQVVGMHGSRPPANFAPLFPVYAGLRWLLAQWGIGPAAAIRGVSLLSLAATALVLLATARASRRDPATTLHLMKWSTLAFAGCMAASKVVNEQYLLIPFVTAVVWAHAGSGPSSLVPALGFGTAAAALLHGMHVVLFVPPDVWAALGVDAGAMVRRVSFMLLGIPFDASKALAAAALVPAAAIVARLLARPVAQLLERRGARRPAHVPAVAAAVALFLAAPGAPVHAPAWEPEGPYVLAIVRGDWWNPAGDPRIPGGTWAGIERPDDGYYSTTAARAEQDVARLMAAGVDGVILVVDPTVDRHGRSWRMALERAGVPYTIASWDLEDVGRLPSWHRALHAPAPVASLAPWLERPYDLREPHRLAQPLLHATGGHWDDHSVFAGTPDELPAFLEDVRGTLFVPWNDHGGLGALEDGGTDVLEQWHLRSP